MSPVRTYVFFDTETTGLPQEEHNRTKIAELSLVAVKREHLLRTRPGATPRVQHKLTLCLNPQRMIAQGCTEVTGLDNYLLEHEPVFDKEVFSLIDTFLKVLTQPVCLIAQNGHRFDFPILRNQLEKLKVKFSVDVLCADCYFGFYDILERKEKMKVEQPTNGVKLQDNELKDHEINKTAKEATIDSTPESPSTSSLNQADLDEIGFYSSNISMKANNETTPKHRLTQARKSRSTKAKRTLFPWGDGSKPSQSYKLKDIYERVLNKPAKDAHRAENDCMLAMEVSVALAKQFVEWVDKNHMKFDDVEPMRLGVPL